MKQMNNDAEQSDENSLYFWLGADGEVLDLDSEQFRKTEQAVRQYFYPEQQPGG